MIIIIGTFGQAVSSDGHAINIFGVLIVWRFIVSPDHHFASTFVQTMATDGTGNWRRLPILGCHRIGIRTNKAEGQAHDRRLC